MTPVARARLAAWTGSLVSTRSRGDARVGEADHPRLTSRNDGLDAIRLAAAAMVFAGHAWLAAGGTSGTAIVNASSIGVAMFFVLSGYLIPTVYAKGGPYWIRRVARIAPGYLFAVIGVGLVTGYSFTVRDLTMTQTFDVRQFDSYMGVAWSLQLEVIFYALVPVLARIPARWIVGAGAMSLIAFLALTAEPGLRATFPARFWMFVPGMILARAAFPRLPGTAAAVGLGLIVLGALTGFVPLGALGAATLVAFAIGRPFRAPRVVVFGATISYGIFLWHHELLRWLRDLGLDPALIVIGGAGATILAAAVSWHLIEGPALRLRSDEAVVHRDVGVTGPRRQDFRGLEVHPDRH